MFDFLKSCAGKDTLTAEDRKRLVEVAEKVEEVVHAEWVSKSKNHSWSTCSICNKEYTFRPNYCPNCGAKMDKKSEK